MNLIRTQRWTWLSTFFKTSSRLRQVFRFFKFLSCFSYISPRDHVSRLVHSTDPCYHALPLKSVAFRLSYVFTGLTCTSDCTVTSIFPLTFRRRNFNFTSAALSTGSRRRRLSTSKFRAGRQRIAECRNAVRENPLGIAGARKRDVSRCEFRLSFSRTSKYLLPLSRKR